MVYKGKSQLIEESLEVKLPTIWSDGKVREEKKRSEKIRRERERRKKMQLREKLGKSRFIVFVPMICGSEGSKSRLAKAAGAEPCGQMRHDKLHAAVARSTFPSQNVQSTLCSGHFFKLRCQKSVRHCGAKHMSKSKCTKHTNFGQLLEGKSARRCGAKHMSKSKCTKHTILSAALEVQRLKKWTRLWREAHFQVKSVKY